MLFNKGPQAQEGEARGRSTGHRSVSLALATVAFSLAACGGGQASPTTGVAQNAGGSTPVATIGQETAPTTQAPGGVATEAPAGPTPTVAGSAQQDATGKVDRSNPVAVVNGENISFEELDTLLETKYGNQELTNLINQKLVEQEVRKRNIQVTDAEIEAELQKAREGFPGQDLEQVVREQLNISIEEFRQQLRLRIAIGKLLEPQIKITEQDLKTYYDANKQQFATPEEFKVARVYTEDEEKAGAAAKELRAGAKTAAVIEKHGTKEGPGAQQSGETDFVPLQELGPDVGQAVAPLEKGKVSDPAPAAEGGFVVAKVLDKRGGDVPPLNEVQDRVREFVREDKLGTLAPTLIDRLRSEAEITNQLAPAEAAPTGEPGVPPVEGTPQG